MTTNPSRPARRRPSPSLSVTVVALVLATAGTSYAAGALPANSVGTPQLKPHSVTVAKLAPATVRRLSGKPGKPGKTGKTGSPGPAGRSALSSLRPGEKITGVWSASGAAPGYAIEAITFPVPASTALDDNHVQLDGFDENMPASTCTGSASGPTAPPGQVCIYFTSQQSVTTNSSGLGARHDFTGGTQTQAATASSSGFDIYIAGPSTGFFANGTWAYTAP